MVVFVDILTIIFTIIVICKNCKKSVTLKATPEVLNMLFEKKEIIIE